MPRSNDPSHPAQTPENLQRRRLLVGAGVAAAGGTLLPLSSLLHAQPAPVKASAADLETFLALSRTLTHHPDLDRGISQRVYVALANDDASFPGKATALANAVKAANITDMSTFKGSAVAQDAGMKALTTTIVSAYYLGYTGEPKGLVNKDNTQFVTYVGALAWAPTKDVTVIPTYARAGTDYWSEPPASIKTD